MEDFKMTRGILVKEVLTGAPITEYEDALWSEIKNDIAGNGYEIYSITEDENDNLVIYVYEIYN